MQNEILELRIPKGSIMTWPGIYMAEWNKDKSP